MKKMSSISNGNKRSLEVNNKNDISRKKPKFTKNHQKKASLDDINRLQLLQEMTDNSNENVCLQQINEILNTTKLPAKYQIFIDAWYSDVSAFLKTIPSVEQNQLITDIEWINKDVIIPLDESNINIPNFKFKFVTPSKISIIGSHAAATIIGPNLSIDIAVEIPAECFEKDNYMNMIYHKKKATYLSYLALKLQAFEQIKEIKFSFFKDNPLCPVLEIAHTSRFHKHVKFYLHITSEINTFKLNRFLPSTSNIRTTLFNDNNSIEEIIPTPNYNSSILSDLVLMSNQEFLINTLSGHSNIRDAIVLLKLWLRSKGLELNLNGYIISMFAIHLLKCRKLNISMSTYDIIKNIWLNLGNLYFYPC